MTVVHDAKPSSDSRPPSLAVGFITPPNPKRQSYATGHSMAGFHPQRTAGITARVLERRRTARRQPRKPASRRVESDSYGSGTDSADELFFAEDTSLLAAYVNRILLVLPVSIMLLIRALTSSDLRTSALAWAFILPLTSDISIDEGIFPALVSLALGRDNSVVARNLYLSMARSRLGLFALAVLSVYFDNVHILVSGILLRSLIYIASALLQNSISQSEISLIGGAVVNAAYHLASVIASREPLSLYDPAVIVACGLAGFVPCYPLFLWYTRAYRNARGRSTASQLWLAAAIYAVYFGVAGYLFFGVCHPHSMLKLGDILWNNSGLLAYWASVLAVAGVVAFALGAHLQLDGRRKLWHVCSLAMFLPRSVRENPFTHMCLAVAIVLFLALEIARATALPPFGVPIHRMLASFIDHRDKRGPVVISHIYLLLGISVPIFLAQSPAGLVCLGVGDTAASQIGRRFGRVRCFGHKSIEGCIAFSVAAFATLWLFTNTSRLWPVAIATALLEAVTPINDNLVVPIYMMVLQCIFSGRS